MPGGTEVALFDFDETLIRPNSLGLLFKLSSGRATLWPLTLPLVCDRSTYALGIRLAIKRRLYRLCVKGRTNDWLRSAGEQAAPRLPVNANVVASLEALAAQGVDVWLVTASPRPFVEGVVAARGRPVERVVGTELTMADGGFDGELANECAGERKVTVIAAELDAHYSRYFVRAAYGNLPVDGPLLALAQCGYSVRKGRVKQEHGSAR